MSIDKGQRVVDMRDLPEMREDSFAHVLLAFFGGEENFARIHAEVQRDIAAYLETGVKPWWMEEVYPSDEWLEQHT